VYMYIYEHIRIRLFVILIYFVCEESWTFCRPRQTLSIRLAIIYMIYYMMYMCVCVCVCVYNWAIRSMLFTKHNIVKNVVAAVTRYIIPAIT
jgi:putative flippase GtrA